jgi:hypothetical protein
MKRLLLCLTVVLALGVIPALADDCGVAGNLVVNCGFETGDFTGWTPIAAGDGSLFGVNGAYVHSGIYGSYWGAVYSLDDSIIQTILPTTAGQSYGVEFWLEHDFTDTDNHFEADWNGNPLVNLGNVAAFGWTDYKFTVVGTGADTLRFAGYEGPAYFGLDDVSVVATPEPTSLALLAMMLAGGLLGTGLKRRRQQ